MLITLSIECLHPKAWAENGFLIKKDGQSVCWKLVADQLFPCNTEVLPLGGNGILLELAYRRQYFQSFGGFFFNLTSLSLITWMMLQLNDPNQLCSNNYKKLIRHVQSCGTVSMVFQGHARFQTALLVVSQSKTIHLVSRSSWCTRWGPKGCVFEWVQMRLLASSRSVRLQMVLAEETAFAVARYFQLRGVSQGFFAFRTGAWTKPLQSWSVGFH